MLFGLGPWILETWASARQAVLGLHSSQQSLQSPLSVFSHLNVVEIIAALQNVSPHSILCTAEIYSLCIQSYRLY
jgi:hypothetical protein